MAITPSFFFKGNGKFHTATMGTIRIPKSRRRLMIPDVTVRETTLMHLPGVRTFHAFSLGVHWNMYAMKAAVW